MADNYLERRMEELRRGETAKNYLTGKTSARKGGLHFAFPPKRVLIVSEHPKAADLALIFLKTESKVAMMHSRGEEGAGMAASKGIRFYHLEEPQQLTGYFSDILKAWRDIDILVTDTSSSDTLLSQWIQHRERFPYVSDYTCRIIILGNQNPDVLVKEAERVKATVNTINSSDPDTDFSPLAAMLAIPANNIINGMIFNV